jgi:hypothetical protein
MRNRWLAGLTIAVCVVVVGALLEVGRVLIDDGQFEVRDALVRGLGFALLLTLLLAFRRWRDRAQ